MRAFLLAAGKGTRLQPITNTIPKCIVPIDGIPMMDYWFSLFRKHGITDVLINLNHFPEQVEAFVAKNHGSINVNLIFEERLLGSLGTIIDNKNFVAQEEDFFVFYADNLTNVDLTKMYTTHQASGFPFTMGLFRANDPKSCGIATLNEDKTVVDFIEKPENPVSDLANAGVYVMNNSLLNTMKSDEDKLLDIGFDLLPKLIGKMKGFEIDDFLLDIGTHENYIFANEFVRQNKSLFSYVNSQ